MYRLQCRLAGAAALVKAGMKAEMALERPRRIASASRYVGGGGDSLEIVIAHGRLAKFEAMRRRSHMLCRPIDIAARPSCLLRRRRRVVFNRLCRRRRRAARACWRRSTKGNRCAALRAYICQLRGMPEVSAQCRNRDRNYRRRWKGRGSRCGRRASPKSE